MALGRSLKLAAVAVVVVSAGGLAATHPQAVTTYYQEIYPGDPAKRQALDVCFMQDHTFNRLDPGQREACYRHILNSAEATSAGTAAQPVLNPIDLERAAAQGSLPRNDVRRLELQETLHQPR